MAMSREEAEKFLHNYQLACLFDEEREYEAQLLTALCADPNAALLETCKRLYDIVYFLSVREVLELGDDAIAASGLNSYVINEELADGTERINLDWAKEAIAAAEEE